MSTGFKFHFLLPRRYENVGKNSTIESLSGNRSEGGAMGKCIVSSNYQSPLKVYIKLIFSCIFLIFNIIKGKFEIME